jgi:transposase-like protein
VLGHWVSDGNEGASFWLGVADVFIVGIDGLTGFKDAIRSALPQVEIQRCLVHQIRNSMKYVLLITTSSPAKTYFSFELNPYVCSRHRCTWSQSIGV